MNFNRKTQDLKKTWNQKSDPYKFMVPNATVWIKLKQPDENLNIFKKALIISVDLVKDLVKVRFLEAPAAQSKENKPRIYEEFSARHVFKVNSLYRPQGYDDFSKMTVVNDAEILWNLKSRYFQSIFYTYIQEMLVFLNADSVPAGLFSRTNMSFYKKMLQKDDALSSKDFLPHIYGEITESIKEIARKNQTIVFCGESRAGKSLNFAKAAEFLSLLNKESKESRGIGEFLDLSDSMHFDVFEELVYAALTVVDAFTCAKTRFNENSSRVVKTFSFLIDKHSYFLKGCCLNLDFLEKKRVATSKIHENFAIFAGLLRNSPENFKENLEIELLSRKCGDFLEKSQENRDFFKLISDSLQVFGISRAEMLEIFRLLACILHLNSGFYEKNTEKTARIHEIIEEILGLPQNSLEISIFPYKNEFITWLYSKIVKYLVKKINISFLQQINSGAPLLENMSFFKKCLETSTNSTTFPGNSANNPSNSVENYGFLHLVDLFGLSPVRKDSNSKENVDFNGFFEFKSHYLLEKVHEMYLKEVFKDEEVSFLQEGLVKNCDFIDFKDNLPIIELIEKPSFGIFRFFLDQIQRNPLTFEEKDIEEIMSRDNHDIFFTGKMTKNSRSFVITHTFNYVYYSIDAVFSEFSAYLTKEKHKKSWTTALLASKNPFFSTILEDKSKFNQGNFIERFQIKAENWVSSLTSSRKRYVFCLEPLKNTENLTKSQKFNAFSCLLQSQVFEFKSLVVRYKEEFPIKIEHSRFYNQFKELLGTATEVFMKERVLDSKNLCEKIVQSAFPEAIGSKFLLGKTQVLLKQDLFLKLEGKKTLILSKRSSSKDERFFASPGFRINLKLSIHGLKQVMKVIIQFQKRFRAKIIRKRFLQKKKALGILLNSYDKFTMKLWLKKYRAQVLSLALKNQKLKKIIRVLQISKNSFVRRYFQTYYNAVQVERAYFSKKNVENENKPSFTKRSSKLIQADAILKQIEREKTIDFKKNSFILSGTSLKNLMNSPNNTNTSPNNVSNQDLSLGKLLKKKLLQTLENKSIFTRLAKKKTEPLKASSFNMDESMDPNAFSLIEDKKSESLDSQTSKELLNKVREGLEIDEIIDSGDFEQKRRKCVTAKSLSEYENKSTKSLLEEFLEYKAKKEPLNLEFEQLPVSSDVYFDFDGLDKRFLEELKREYFEETWKKIIVERTVWGQKQKYSKLMSFQAKILDNSLLDLPAKFKDLAKKTFKYILQYSEDRKTKFSKATQLNKLIVLLLSDNNCSFLQDEIYLQIMKQLSNNPNNNSINHLLNLLAIISSLIPPSSNILMSVLNFLYIKALLNNDFNEELAKKCKYIFIRISKIFEIGARKYVPMDSEIACIENCKQIMYPIFFLTGEHVLVNCESYTLIKEIKEFIMNKFKINAKYTNNLGIFFMIKISKENSFSTHEEGYLDDKSKFMDILAKWDSIRKINLKSDFIFESKIYLKIRANFEYLSENTSNTSKDEIALLYVQSVYDFLFDKFALNEKEILVLAAIKMAVDFGDFSEEKVRFLKINIQDYIPASKLENYAPQVWIDRILVNYLTLKTYSKTQARQLFLKNLRKFEYFNAQVYLGKYNICCEEKELTNLQQFEVISKNSEKYFIWTFNCLIISDDLKKTEEKIPFSEITEWGKLNKCGVFFVREQMEHKKIYNLVCDKYKEFEFLLRFYVKTMLKSI